MVKQQHPEAAAKPRHWEKKLREPPIEGHFDAAHLRKHLTRFGGIFCERAGLYERRQL